MPYSAPEFPSHLEWINAAPLTLASQRGKLVLLDFWTYCCINCMHVLPDLHYLEKKYPDTLTVIGIHSPKFPNEHVTKQVKLAIARYGIVHPIANDPALTVWQAYSVHAWPTFVLIDTEGKIIATLSGEGQRQRLEQLIEQQLMLAAEKNTLRPHFLQTEKPFAAGKQLAFPGKVHATESKLYISDSNHQRIIETDHQHNILRTLAEGKLHNPQGLAVHDHYLYVADTAAHAMRKINLLTGEYTMLAEQLNSPWDIAIAGQQMFIAMAGQHQIWIHDFLTQETYPFAGSRLEHLQDGPPAWAAFAQPSGLTSDGHNLYVADAETSAIRAVNITNGQVKTLVGTGLFDFGDKDGFGQQAQLQHPLGVSYDADRHVLWIADTYNHRIRQLALNSLQVTTLPLQIPLNEPGGLHYQQHYLWIADTNHHRIVRVNLLTNAEEIFFG